MIRMRICFLVLGLWMAGQGGAWAQLKWDQTEQEVTLSIRDTGADRDFTFRNVGKTS